MLSPRRTVIAVAIVAALAAATAASPAAAACRGAGKTPTADTVDRARKATLCLLNVKRRRHGLPRLRASAKLRQAADAHARDMDANNYFSHVAPGGVDVLDRIRATGFLNSATGGWTVGENLAWGSGRLSSPRQAVVSWMNSSAHRANILNGRFRRVGIGIALGLPVAGASGATYVTNFGGR